MTSSDIVNKLHVHVQNTGTKHNLYIRYVCQFICQFAVICVNITKIWKLNEIK